MDGRGVADIAVPGRATDRTVFAGLRHQRGPLFLGEAFEKGDEGGLHGLEGSKARGLERYAVLKARGDIRRGSRFIPIGAGRAQARGLGFEGFGCGEGVGPEPIEQDFLFIVQVQAVAEAHDGDFDGLGTAVETQEIAARMAMAVRGAGVNILPGLDRGGILRQGRGHGAQGEGGGYQGRDGGRSNGFHERVYPLHGKGRVIGVQRRISTTNCS
jgi:hypothetical protein